MQATPTPGPGVFGHAGGIVDNTIVYCDGVAIEAHENRRRDFVAVNNCYRGIIDEEDSRRIDWRVVDAHPGLPRYRMAAAGVGSMNGVVFVGGSNNPYNYSGIGYNGEPSEPETDAMLFDVSSGEWQLITVDGVATMDHRGLVSFGGALMTIGGMEPGQAVSNRVYRYVP